MPSPDLPVELWLEILRYLPRSTLHKMIGVNRVLFELALDDLYSEVRFISVDKETAKMFAQLRCVFVSITIVAVRPLTTQPYDNLLNPLQIEFRSHPNISMRVRHLFIRPAFLPTIDRDLIIDSKSHSVQHNVSTMLTSIKHGIQRATSTLGTSTSRADQSNHAAFLKTAKIVKACPNLREITLVVHDQTLTPSFMLFLNSLWASDGLCQCLRSLTLDTTVAKLPLVLKPLTKRAAALPNMASLDINISISRIAQSEAHWRAASNALANFLRAFSGSLASLAFSSLISCDINELFDSFPKLPKLTTFEFRSVFNADTFPNTEALTRFVRRHAQTLTTLLIKPRARSATVSSSDDSYSVWLNHPPARHSSERLYSLTQLVLPKLRTLDVGLYEVWATKPAADQMAQDTAFNFLPDLTRVTPNLTRLVITDIKLNAQRIVALLAILRAQDGDSALEEFVFATHVVHPQLFDSLARALPRLRALTIECTRYRTSASDEGMRRWTDTHNTVNAGFAEAMRARTYPHWELRYLRLESMYHCGAPHPNVATMKSVAESLPRDVVLDGELRCDCMENINYLALRLERS